MLCDWCKKNEATIHIQEIVGGEKKSIHVCGQCAAAKAHENSSAALGPFNLAEMLYNLAAKNPAAAGNPESGSAVSSDFEGAPRPIELSSCPVCHWSLEDLRCKGRLGCPQCYEYFRPIIAGVLPNMHRGKLHVGKRPGESAGAGSPDITRVRLEMMGLQKDLEEVIQREEYERAAILRDKINALRQMLERHEPSGEQHHE